VDFTARVFAVAAERIAAALPPGETLFHSADQQLALISAQDNDAVSPLPEAAEKVAERVAQAIEAPIPMDGHAILLHPSIGIAEATSGYDSAEALLDQAGMAAAAVPPDSESRYCRYSSATARASAERLQLEADLERAFQEGQFVLEYEPFIQPLSQTAVGFEALIRWNHPTEGRLSPGRFLPLALQAGMAHRLNAWVMGEAARQAAAWRRVGLTELFINFNLTAEAFVRPHLVEEMAALLGELELPGQQLIVELTESTLLQDARAAARTLHGLAELGVGAWLDDFGTGYSSLSHLRALPLKGVKIDRSFTERIDIDSRDYGFIKALIDLISYLGMQSIAEGVESASQYELLGMTSCDLYQGYYFARSMPASEVEGWLQRRGQRSTTGATTAARSAPIPTEQVIG
jgi:EAL domain-containing protein (putative c-di-GMP-specific phosphodiesterase class I)